MNAEQILASLRNFLPEAEEFLLEVLPNENLSETAQTHLATIQDKLNHLKSVAFQPREPLVKFYFGSPSRDLFSTIKPSSIASPLSSKHSSVSTILTPPSPFLAESHNDLPIISSVISLADDPTNTSESHFSLRINSSDSHEYSQTLTHPIADNDFWDKTDAYSSQTLYPLFNREQHSPQDFSELMTTETVLNGYISIDSGSDRCPSIVTNSPNLKKCKKTHLNKKTNSNKRKRRKVSSKGKAKKKKLKLSPKTLDRSYNSPYVISSSDEEMLAGPHDATYDDIVPIGTTNSAPSNTHSSQICHNISSDDTSTEGGEPPTNYPTSQNIRFSPINSETSENCHNKSPSGIGSLENDLSHMSEASEESDLSQKSKTSEESDLSHKSEASEESDLFHKSKASEESDLSHKSEASEESDLFHKSEASEESDLSPINLTEDCESQNNTTSSEKSNESPSNILTPGIVQSQHSDQNGSRNATLSYVEDNATNLGSNSLSKFVKNSVIDRNHRQNRKITEFTISESKMELSENIATSSSSLTTSPSSDSSDSSSKSPPSHSSDNSQNRIEPIKNDTQADDVIDVHANPDEAFPSSLSDCETVTRDVRTENIIDSMNVFSDTENSVVSKTPVWSRLGTRDMSDLPPAERQELSRTLRSFYDVVHQNPTEPGKCDECRGMILVTKGKMYKCKQCSAKFSKIEEFDRHRKPGGDSTFCPQCKIRCRSNCLLNQHKQQNKRRHPNRKLCDVCLKVAQSRPEVSSIESTSSSAHDIEGSYRCMKCSKRFKFKSKLDSHTQKHHINMNVSHFISEKSVSLPPSRPKVDPPPKLTRSSSKELDSDCEIRQNINHADRDFSLIKKRINPTF